MKLQPPIPVLRIFDVDLAKAFYGDWLGFALDWTHQFEPGFPFYLQMSRGLSSSISVNIMVMPAPEPSS